MAFDMDNLIRFLRKNKIRRAIFAAMNMIQKESGSDLIELDTLSERFEEGKIPPGGVACGRKELIDFLRELDESQKAGIFTIGRRGGKTRFAWFDVVDMDLVRQAMNDTCIVGREQQVAPPSSIQESISMPQVPRAEVLVAPVRTIRHSFVLRPDYTFVFDLPSDFSEVEARRVSQMITSLPMAVGETVLG